MLQIFLNEFPKIRFYFLRKEGIDIISETHLTNKYNFNIPGFVFHKTNHPKGKAHGGTGTLVRYRLRHHALNQFSKDYIQATSISVECIFDKITISSAYCPPRFTITKDKFEEFCSSLGCRFLACGDYNAKHTYWGSRLANRKGKQLYKVLTHNKNGLEFLSPGQPTYWLTDP